LVHGPSRSRPGRPRRAGAAAAAEGQAEICGPRLRGCGRGNGRPWPRPADRGSARRCAELLGVELATVSKAAAKVEPYRRADGTKVWSLMQLEQQLRPEACRRRRGVWVPVIRSRHATCAYSWTSPPSRSRRTTLPAGTKTIGSPDPSGGTCPKARC